MGDFIRRKRLLLNFNLQSSQLALKHTILSLCLRNGKLDLLFLSDHLSNSHRRFSLVTSRPFQLFTSLNQGVLISLNVDGLCPDAVLLFKCVLHLMVDFCGSVAALTDFKADYLTHLVENVGILAN